ncbi:hypothetical protein Bca52824_062569 [Brassica carinata]|uniref:Uncharacterized protein n=1 Tax=Brassica carinata TaxID=52824 RepID=A0A8X7QI82_BRACI|nr:hypothetical protein Bca52824_062569 [Brassica carinata]
MISLIMPAPRDQRREVLHKFTVDLPRKHERGGQSVLHFARLSMEKRHNYVRKTGELATLLYINPATIQPNVAASTKRLSSVKFIQEKKLIAKYFEEISLDTGKYALEMGAIETLIVWENLDINRYELKNSTSGEVVVNHFGKDQETDQSNFLRFIPGKIYVQLLPSSNIKSRANRQSVLSSLAITCAQQGLKLYNKVPSNGLVLYTGTIFTVDLPRKHERGGQSVLHFARLSMEKRHNYVRKTGELATLLYINPATIQPNVAASTKRLSSVKFIQEKKLIAKYFEEISLDTGKYELKNSTSGEVVVNHFGKDQETDQSNFLRTEKDASA